MNFDLETVRLILAVVVWLAKQKAWLKGPSPERLKHLEANIMHYLAEKKQWTTPGMIWADLVLLPILQDVRFDEAFPPQDGKWVRFKWGGVQSSCEHSAPLEEVEAVHSQSHSMPGHTPTLEGRQTQPWSVG